MSKGGLIVYSRERLMCCLYFLEDYIMSAMRANPNEKFEKLALDGGEPVRHKPLPLEFPGGHFIDHEEIDAVCCVLKRKSPFRYYGFERTDETDLFENQYAEYCRRKYALGVSSGTAALSISLAALGVGPGQEVLVPGYFWVSSVSAIVRAGAIPVLVDIDETFCMNPKDFEKKITRKSSVVLLVHMSGAPGRLDEICRITSENGLKMLADCAQANGASFKGKPIGSYGDIAIFSFQLNKNMTAGEGGMIVCDDKQLYNRIFACHDMGYARDAAGRLDTNDQQYQLWGQGCRMTEITAAMGRVQLRKLPKIVHKMNTAKYKIRKGLSDIEGIKFRTIIDPEGDSGPFLITIFPSSDICQKFVKALRCEGIAPPKVGLSNVPMTQWGLHIYYNNSSLVNKTSISDDGSPWSHPANKDSNYNYAKGTLTSMDDLISRSSILSIPSVLTDEDIGDIVCAYHKVAAHIPLK